MTLATVAPHLAPLRAEAARSFEAARAQVMTLARELAATSGVSAAPASRYPTGSVR
jgi:hypothetical protein